MKPIQKPPPTVPANGAKSVAIACCSLRYPNKEIATFFVLSTTEALYILIPYIVPSKLKGYGSLTATAQFDGLAASVTFRSIACPFLYTVKVM